MSANIGRPMTNNLPHNPPARPVIDVLALYVAFVGVLGALESTRFLRATQHLAVPLQLAIHVGLALATGLGGTWILVRRDPRPIQSLGLAPIPVRMAIGFGGVGFVLAYAGSATLGATWLIASRTNLNDLLQGRGPILELFAATPLWMVLPLAVLVGFYEEVVFRGFILGRLREALRSTRWTQLRQDIASVAVCAALFGLLHAYQGAYGVFQTTGAGLGLGALAVWRRSVWPSIVAHAGVDTFGLVALHVLMPLLKDLLKTLPHAPAP